ncbi:unnamed protein product [Meloidogyne enterolobii]|uniref:Uncharacterized protein n=1 Tax=Meloidogyne enterolobii TaxID=390850 RepID=A0ACB0XUL9_MELEN
MSRTYVKWKYSLIINQTYPKFHIRFSSKETDTMFTEPSMCIDNPIDNILSPSTWEIVGTSPEPTMNRLLVFHLLPQRASRKRMLMINKGTGLPEYVVTKDHPEGPKCDEMTIIFSRQNYSLLFTPVSQKTTSTSKDPTDVTTSIITTSSNRDNHRQETTMISTSKPSFKVGLGDHILQDGKVILAKGSVVAKKEDLELYKASSADACDVDFVEGNIVLHYTSQGTTKDKGCTVDLLTDRKDEIVFWIGVHNRGGLYECLNGSDINSNVLPFAYSLTNGEVKKFHNGPIFADQYCPSCLEGCVKKTGLEVSWEYDEDQGRANAVLYINPIGTKLVYYIRKEWNLSSTEVYFNQTYINQKAPKFLIKDLMRHRNSQPSTICMNNPKEIILSPSTWEIVGTSPEPSMNRLLVFHLLPQKASRRRIMKNIRNGFPEYVVRKEHPDGPKCDEMRIVFVSDKFIFIPLMKYSLQSRDNYKLLTTTSFITSTPKPTQGPTNKEETSTTSPPTSKNDRTISTSKKTTKTLTKTLTSTSSRTTTITKATTKITTTTTTKGSSFFLFFVVIIVILAVIGIGIAIYFFVIREEDDEEDNEEGDGTKGDVTGEDQEKEDIKGEDNNASGEAQKIEDEEVKEEKDDVKGDDQKKEHVTGEEQKKDEAVEDDNKAKEKIETTAKTVEDSASINKGETKEEQASA